MTKATATLRSLRSRFTLWVIVGSVSSTWQGNRSREYTLSGRCLIALYFSLSISWHPRLMSGYLLPSDDNRRSIAATTWQWSFSGSIRCCLSSGLCTQSIVGTDKGLDPLSKVEMSSLVWHSFLTGSFSDQAGSRELLLFWDTADSTPCVARVRRCSVIRRELSLMLNRKFATADVQRFLLWLHDAQPRSWRQCGDARHISLVDKASSLHDVHNQPQL